MTPFSFEWQWNIEYLIFMGLLYLALMIIGAGLVYTYIKSWIDIKEDSEGKLPPAIDYRSKYTEY
jgi:hypothetical protein